MAVLTVLVQFVIYNSPKDYPGQFVCRRWLIFPGKVAPDERIFCSGSTLQKVRNKIPANLHCVPRSPGDDPVIVETWL